MTATVDDRRRGRQADGRLEGDPGGIDERSAARARVDLGGGVTATVSRQMSPQGMSAVMAIARAASERLSVEKRRAFRERWLATGAEPAGLDGEDLQLRIGVLFERVGEVVQDVEDGRSDLLATALGEALAEIDCLDEALTDLEAWVRQLAMRQGVDFTPARERRRAELGLAPGEDLTLTDGRHG